MRSRLKRLLGSIRPLARRLILDPEREQLARRRESLFSKAGWFLLGNGVEGDYLEFGVFRGDSLIEAYHALQDVYTRAGGELVHGGHLSREDADRIHAEWSRTRFYAFDSFAGLPAPAASDRDTFLFEEGKYASSLEDVMRNLARGGVPEGRVIPVPGWYETTCTEATRQRLNLRPAAIVHIDCDLYASTVPVLRFLTPLLQEGTVLIFDDWFHYRAHPRKGERRAFLEWHETLEQWQTVEYHKEGAFRNSFIVTAR